MVKIADTLRILGNHQAAVFQYRAAIDLAGINEIIILNADLIQPVTQAEEYVRQGVWQAASDMYQTAMQEIIKYYVYQTHVVESGDYLSQLANYYNTTTQVILDANNLSDPNDLSIGERIIIPVVP
jgi:LysM repeat protein